MHLLRLLLLPALVFCLAGYKGASLQACLAETTVQCALDESIAAARSLEDERERASAFAYIARVQADIGRTAEARDMLAKVYALKRGIMDSRAQDGLESGIARIHALLGERGRALEVAEGIGDPARAALTYAWIAQAQAAAGETEAAGRTIALAVEKSERSEDTQLAFLFSQLAIAQAHTGDRKVTLAVADVALRLSWKFNGNMLKARSVSAIAVAEYVAGAGERAAASLQQIRDLVAQMEADREPAKDLGSGYAYLAWAEALAGEPDNAMASLEPLKRLIGDGLEGYSQSSQLAATALVLGKIRQ